MERNISGNIPVILVLRMIVWLNPWMHTKYQGSNMAPDPDPDQYMSIYDEVII